MPGFLGCCCSPCSDGPIGGVVTSKGFTEPWDSRAAAEAKGWIIEPAPGVDVNGTLSISQTTAIDKGALIRYYAYHADEFTFATQMILSKPTALNAFQTFSVLVRFPGLEGIKGNHDAFAIQLIGDVNSRVFPITGNKITAIWQSGQPTIGGYLSPPTFQIPANTGTYDIEAYSKFDIVAKTFEMRMKVNATTMIDWGGTLPDSRLDDYICVNEIALAGRLTAALPPLVPLKYDNSSLTIRYR